MITSEESTEIVSLLTLLAFAGVMSLHGVPATTSRGARGKLTIFCHFLIFFLLDIGTPTTPMSPAGDSLQLVATYMRIQQIQIPCEC